LFEIKAHRLLAARALLDALLPLALLHLVRPLILLLFLLLPHRAIRTVFLLLARPVVVAVLPGDVRAVTVVPPVALRPRLALLLALFERAALSAQRSHPDECV
jgi:hypothetical protein